MDWTAAGAELGPGTELVVVWGVKFTCSTGSHISEYGDGDRGRSGSPEDRGRLHAERLESPAMGDNVTIRVGDHFQVWRVAERRWEHVFPADGQMTPCAVLTIGLRRVGEAL